MTMKPGAIKTSQGISQKWELIYLDKKWLDKAHHNKLILEKRRTGLINMIKDWRFFKTLPKDNAKSLKCPKHKNQLIRTSMILISRRKGFQAINKIKLLKKINMAVNKKRNLRVNMEMANQTKVSSLLIGKLIME